jgi:hypothetical protein
MPKKSVLAAFLLFLSLLAPLDRALAQIDNRDIGPREGWTRVQDGVLSRELRPNEIETFVYGIEGFTWKLQDLRSQLQVLRREFAAHPTPELRKTIASHRKAIASTLERIEQARNARAGGETKTSPFMPLCDGSSVGSFTYDADAASKTQRQGVWANASVDYSPAPGCDYPGEVYAYAFAKTTVNGAATTATVTDGPRSGTYASANAEASRNGGFPCESYSYASVTTYSYDELTETPYNPISYSKSTVNESCPPPSPLASPLQVSVTSDQPSTIILTGSLCVNITWTVNISGGTPAYRSKIYRNDVYGTHGTNYSESLCGSQHLMPFYGNSLTIRADVIDSGGQSTSVFHTTTVIHK